MLPQRPARPTPREITLLVGAVLLGALLLAALTAANAHWGTILPGGAGFYTIWAGAREFLFLNGDPYGLPAAARAQQLAQGNSLGLAADLQRLDLPFFLLPLYFPVALISEPGLARAVWATAAQLAFVASMIVCTRLVEWNPSRAALLSTCLVALAAYPALNAFVEGSPIALLLLVYFSILWAMQQGHEELAGALITLALCKWEVGLPFLLILAVSSVRERRWRMWAGFAMALTILLAASFMVYPGWVMPFLVGTVANLRSAYGVSTHSALAQLLPADAKGLGIALAVVVLALLLVELIGSRTGNFRHFAWTATLAMAATPLLGMKSELTSLVVLAPAVVMIAAGGAHRQPYGSWLSLLLLAAILVVPWVLMPIPLVAPSTRALAFVFLFLPLASVAAMYWTRWWFLRPPRTWMDEIRASR